MNKIIEHIKEYDAELTILDNLLSIVVDTFSANELATLEKDKSSEEYLMFINKLVNRYVDYVRGYIIIQGSSKVVMTMTCAITELDISLDTYKECLDAGYYCLKDILNNDSRGLSNNAVTEIIRQLGDRLC